MAAEEGLLLAVADAIADLRPIDWSALAPQFARTGDSPLVRQLQILARIAEVHRSTPLGEVPTGAAPVVSWPPSGQAGESATTVEAPAVTWCHLELLEKIGEGAFGEVFKAWDPKLARQVAVKLLRSNGQKGAPVSDEVLNEGRLLARIRHPNVVTVYGADRADGVVGVWMEYLRGRTLADLVRREGPFSPREAILIGSDLCRALAAVHRAGLVHGDLKAQNVIREEGGRVVLMDFGAGRDLEALAGAPLKAVGTPLYMAPERFDGGPPSALSDIYSLGVLLHHLVTGSYPVEGSSMQDLRAAHARGARRLLRDTRPDLPAAFIQVAERAIAPNPDARYASAGAMEAALTGALTMPGDAADTPAPSAERPVTATATAGVEAGTKQRAARRVLIAGIGLALVVALGVAAWALRGRWPGGPASAQIDSIAVLPLENLSGNPEHEFFADGLTDQLIADLAKIKALRVISRTSVMLFKGKRVPLGEIARQLNVRGVVEGSVLRVGDRVRITVRLIQAGTDTHVWSDTYEGDVRDVFGLQGRLARSIARGIRVSITPNEEQRLMATRQADPAAQDAYLRGRQAMVGYTRSAMQTAIGHFDEALRIDPNYAVVYPALATSYFVLNVLGAMSNEDGLARARDSAERGLALDPTLAEAHVVLGDISFLYDWNWRAAEESYRRALELNPNDAYAHAEYGWFLSADSRLQEALQVMLRAQELDPLSLLMKSNVAGVQYYARDYDQAIAQCRRILEIDSNFALAHVRLGHLYAEKGRFDESIAELQRAIAIAGRDPGKIADLARVQAMAGRRSEAESLLRELTAGRPGQPPVSAERMAFVYAAVGDRDRAFEQAQRAIDERALNISWLPVDPHYDPLRNDPRFPSLIDRLGRP